MTESHLLSTLLGIIIPDLPSIVQYHYRTEQRLPRLKNNM